MFRQRPLGTDRELVLRRSAFVKSFGRRIGQPHRVKYLDQILNYVMSHDGVWQTTADEIAEYYIAHYYDQAIAHAAQLNAQS